MKKSLPYIFILGYAFLGMPAYADSQAQTWLTIFVHGIMSIKPHLSVSNFIRFISDDVQNTVYEKTVELMRQNSLYYQNQAMQEIGLKEIDPYDVVPGNASSATALVFEQMNRFATNNAPLDNHYYTFGWTGLLSPKQRFIDAIELYKAVSTEVARYKAQGINPKVRIIGYSHGGNVLLNLALVRQQQPDITPFTVNELILLGMPVQSETDYLINDPIFELVYHIYSRGDRIQKLDFFSTKRFFSRRLFKKRRGFELPDKLIQIQIKCTRNAGNANNQTYVNLYDFKNKSVLFGKSRYLRDASPGHTELWFFSWTPGNYRQNFPLSPLPVSSLIPLILREAHNFKEKKWFEKPTLIDIRPEQEVVIVRNQKSQQTIKVTQFLPQSMLKDLANQVLLYKPAMYTQERYTQGIQEAYNAAMEFRRDLVKQERKNKKGRNRIHKYQCSLATTNC